MPMPLSISRSLNRLNILFFLVGCLSRRKVQVMETRLPFIGNRCCPTIKISRYMRHKCPKAFEAFSPKHSHILRPAMIHRSTHDLRLSVWEGNLPSNTKGRWLLGCKRQVATLPAQTLPNYVADGGKSWPPHGCSYGGTCCSFDRETFLCMRGLTLSIYACYEQVTFVTGEIPN